MRIPEWREFKEQKVLIGAAVGFVVGLFLGLVVLGWNVWPVQWYDTDPADLKQEHKEAYITLVADSYAINKDLKAAKARLELLEEPDLAKRVGEVAVALRDAGKLEEAARVSQLAEAVAGPGGVAARPSGTATPAPTKPQPSTLWGRISTVCGILVFLLLVAVGGYLALFLLNRGKPARKRPRPLSSVLSEEGGFSPSEEADYQEEGRLKVAAEAMETPLKAERAQLQPLGHFSTTYSLGDDDYDTSFDIETPVGEFLGQCGIGVSETLDDSKPQKVLAFELWLFDKSDVRTVSKILVSEHVLQDASLQDRLSVRGEIVPVEKGKVIALDTAKLRVEVRVISFAYAGGAPPKSHFSDLSVEFAVLAKG